MSLKENVAKVIENIGGSSNVTNVTHCVTRLRLLLKDENLVNTNKLEENELVKGSYSTNGQFQIIIGPGLVEKVYNELVSQTNADIVSEDEMKQVTKEKGNIIQKGVRLLADIFIPILPAIVAAGLLLGLDNLLSNSGIFFKDQSFLDVYTGWEGFAEFINFVANTAFTFLPVLIAWSAAKRFGSNPLLGIVLGLLLVHPDLMSANDYAESSDGVEYWNLFGLNIAKVGYQGQVLPVIFSTYLLAWSEKNLKKIIPDNFQMLFVAPIALVFASLVTFGIIGPTVMTGSNWITDGVLYLFKVSPVLAGGVYAFISAPLIITGMHHIFLGVNLQMAGTLGYVTLWPVSETVTLSMGAATLAMFFILKHNQKLKSISFAATISAWLGVTEPAIYGINLRFRYPFIAVMISSAIGGAFIAYHQVKATSVGVGGLLSFLSVYPEHWFFYFTGMGITFVATVLLTLFFHKSKLFNNSGNRSQSHRKVYNSSAVYAPLSGTIKELTEVPDPTFSQKMMGDGVAIEPTNGELVAPIEGEVVQLFPTLHAIGLQGKSGIELLIHIGLDTVSLEGKGFEAHVKQGDHVKIGDPLLTFNPDFIRESTFNPVTPVIMTNRDDFSSFKKTENAEAIAGKSVLFHINSESKKGVS